MLYVLWESPMCCHFGYCSLCSLGYLHIFQTAKWTKIQKAEKKKRVLVLGKKEHNRDTFYILYEICNVYYIV